MNYYLAATLVALSACTSAPSENADSGTTLPDVTTNMVAGCFIVASSQRLLQRPLSLVLERAEDSQKGLFTLAATTMAALISILTVAQKLWG